MGCVFLLTCSIYGIPVWLSFLVGVCGLMIFIETILIFMKKWQPSVSTSSESQLS